MNLGPLKDRSKPRKGWKKGIDKAGVFAIALIGVAVVGVTIALTSVQPESDARATMPGTDRNGFFDTATNRKTCWRRCRDVVEPPQIILKNPVDQTKVIGSHVVEALVFNSTLQQWSTHEGIDLESAAGSPVYAAMDGTIVSAQSDALWGNVVVIRHDSQLQTLYAGLEGIGELKAGDKVKKGETIGTVGNTAIKEADMGNHLHFEVLVNNESVNPEDYLPGLTK